MPFLNMQLCNKIRAAALALLVAMLGVPCSAQWTQVRQAWNSTAGTSPATTSVTLSLVNQGDVVLVSVDYLGTATGFTVAVTDGNGHSFTQTPNSPCTYSTGQKVWMYYIVAPALATMSITATPSVAHGVSIHAIEFAPTAGTVTFDSDVCGNPITGTTPVNTPSITPSKSGVLYAASIADPSANLGSFSGVVGGSWTIGTVGVIASDNNNSADEWQVSATSATAVNWTVSSSGNSGWVAMAMSMYTVTPPNLAIKGKVFLKGNTKIK
jgi:hypothetical protein